MEKSAVSRSEYKMLSENFRRDHNEIFYTCTSQNDALALSGLRKRRICNGKRVSRHFYLSSGVIPEVRGPGLSQMPEENDPGKNLLLNDQLKKYQRKDLSLCGSGE